MATPTQTAPAEELVLPGWLGELLKPGVGPGIFTTLKLSLVCLVLTLCVMLIYIEDEVSTQRIVSPRAPLRSPVVTRSSAGLFTRRIIISALHRSRQFTSHVLRLLSLCACRRPGCT